ncbi:MAG: SpoIVB peptidase [Ruminococcus sp.]|nr:SpoIVB peptidase [Ruminococcus sp.]
MVKNKFLKLSAAVLSAALLGLYSAAGFLSSNLPDSITTDSYTVKFAAYPDLQSKFTADNQATVSIMGQIPVKAVTVSHKEAPTLIAGGYPFGIKLLMEGVMVTDMSNVDGICCPAADAGIEKGDIITHADNIPLTSNHELSRIIAESGGDTVTLDIKRDGRAVTASLCPVFSEKEKIWRSGMWVRDSVAGIGTLTFTDKATGSFSGLGHPICDADTGELVPLHSGEAVPVKITSVLKGKAGSPGALHGQFTGLPSYGSLTNNNNCGIFGSLGKTAGSRMGKPVEYKLGYRQDVSEGEAFILSTTNGTEPQMYSIFIEEVDYNSHEPSKNMVIRITDEALIDETGGIVQGMSGSPIIQNDRLIGAVTHVFVADPTRGYGIFAENMYNEMNR